MEVYHLVQQMKSIYKSSNERLNTLEKQLTKNLTEAGITTRQTSSNGLWCCILLPAILINYSIMYKVSHIYMIDAFVSIGLLCHMALFTIFITVSSSVLKESTFSGCTASSMLSALLIYTFLMDNLLKALLLGALPVISNFHLLIFLLRQFPNTFSLGEAMIVSQTTVLYGCIGLAECLIGSDQDFVNATVYTVLFGTVCMMVVISKLTEEDRNLRMLGVIVMAFGGVVLVLLHYMLGWNFVIDFFFFVFQHKRSRVVGAWLSLVVLAILIMYSGSSRGIKANTVMRKIFHILASLVFLSGIVWDVEFLRMASGILFSVLLFVETLRKSRIQPIAGYLQCVFEVYCDEKDCGCLAVTPIYLFAALGCPLLLVPPHQGHQLELLSGVLSIGIGDSAASWVGSRYGRIKWPNSEKTLEGSVANAAFQVFTVYLLMYFGLIITRNALPRATIAALASSFVEAHTAQVDNLVIPLVTILAFQCTAFL